MENHSTIEHPRTFTRHIVDEEETPKTLGTVTLCGLVLSNSPELILGDGDECNNCRGIAGC